MRISETVLKEIAMGKYEASEIHVNTPPTYQEDRAFMKRMEKISFDQMSKQELKKIYRIALSGLNVRFAIEMKLADISRRKAQRIADGTINNGLKHSEIFERVAEMLRGLRG